MSSESSFDAESRVTEKLDGRKKKLKVGFRNEVVDKNKEGEIKLKKVLGLFHTFKICFCFHEDQLYFFLIKIIKVVVLSFQFVFE